MNHNQKYSEVINKFHSFISSIDGELINFNQNEINENLKDSIESSIEQLHALSLQVVETIKNKKEENKVEKGNLIEQLNLYSNSGMASASDLSNLTKNLIQKTITNIELQFSENSSKFAKPVIGSIWSETNEWVEKINESIFKKETRSSDVQLTISPSTTDELFALLNKRFSLFAESNISAFNKINKKICNEINALLKERNINIKKPIAIETDISLNYREIIKSSLRFDLPYQGSYPKASFKTIIMEVRSYSVMFIILLSMFGYNKNSFKDNPSVMTIITIVSLLLIVSGVLVTYTKVLDTKTEKLEEEIRKAKDRILSEIKRAANEFVSDFKNLVLSKYKFVLTEFSSEIDQIIRKDSKIKEDEKQQLNSYLKQLETKERQLGDFLKKGEDLLKHIVLIKSEINIINT